MSPIIDKFTVVQLEKADLKVLRWVMLARSDVAERLSIQGICVKEREYAATNGFQVHIARPVGEMPLPVGNWLVRSIQGSFVILEPNGTEFPYYSKFCVVKPMGAMASQAYMVAIAVDPRRMKATMSMKTNSAKITAGYGPLIIEMRDEEMGYELIGVLMPMHVGGSSTGVRFIPTLNPVPEAK